MRKVERRRDDDVRQLLLRLVDAGTRDERSARFDQHRQHDEEIAGDKRRDEAVARQREDVAGADRGQRRHETRQDPQAHQQRHADVGDEEDLQAPELLEAQRAGRRRRDGKQSVRRELNDEPRGARERAAGDLQQVEQNRFAVEADDGDAKDDREQHHGGHDVVRQRVEGIGRNVEVDEIERRPAFEERRAEERGRLDRRERQRHQHRVEQANRPERHEHGAGAQAQPPGFCRLQRAQTFDDGNRDVGEDRHLEQLDEAVRRPLENERFLAEEQTHQDAEGEADEDLAGRSHGVGSRLRAQAQAKLLH